MKVTRPAFAGIAVAIAALVVLVLAVSGGSAKKSRPAVAPGSAISVRQTSLGKTLVDANGRTLYLFAADKHNVSTLSQAGFAVWPAFTANGAPKAGPGTRASAIGTATAPGGQRLVTYNGHPLYYYVGDQNPGQTHGQGLNQFGARWYVVSPSGNAVVSGPSATATPAPATGSYGGY